VGARPERPDAIDEDVEPEARDASRRSYLAEERTLLAWWRSGLAAFAVAIGVGRLLPAFLDDEGKAPFVALGVACAILGLAFVVFGSFRERAQAQALAQGGFAPFSRAVVIALSVYLAGLAFRDDRARALGLTRWIPRLTCDCLVTYLALRDRR
jgi:inner membrane protein YidH